MASHSPQRTRPKPQQAHSGVLPPREMSPSPHNRPRNSRPQSMPLTPTMMQLLAAQNAAQANATQSSPTMSNVSNRRSPTIRQLPSPPQNDRLVETPPSASSSSAPLPVPAPVPSSSSIAQPRFQRTAANTTAHFLTSFQQMDQNWEMTDELLAEINQAAADQQRQHQEQQAHYGSLPGESQLRDMAVERVKNGERSSPSQVTRQAPRDSPKVRERVPQSLPPQVHQHSNPASPTAPTFASSGSVHPPLLPSDQGHSSPYQTPLTSPGEHTAGYTQYGQPNKRESPPIARRGTITDPRGVTAGQTPPVVQAARSPDRSLPVQEEAEDDAHVVAQQRASERRERSPSRESARDTWHERDLDHNDSHRMDLVSPAPSSDIQPVGPRYDVSHIPGGRESRAGFHDDAEIQQQQKSSDDDSFTPRSPTADLPPDAHDQAATNGFTAQQDASGNYQTIRATKHRNGVMDQYNLRSLDPSVFAQQSNGSEASPSPAVQQQQHQTPPEQHRKPVLQRSQTDYHQNVHHLERPNGVHQYSYPDVNGNYAGALASSGPSVGQGQVHIPDDMQSLWEYPTSAYIHSFVQSPRPNAPIPPTPHSQTAAPSPSPYVDGMSVIQGMLNDARVKDGDNGEQDIEPRHRMPYSPIAPAGSPYPYPFTHVRRAQSYSNQHPNRPFFHVNGTSVDQSSVNGNNQPVPAINPNDPAVIQEQFVRQWQVYAQNNQGYVSDSTLSPSASPFPGSGGDARGMFNPWANWHARRTFGGAIGRGLGPNVDLRSLQSSPSHEPVQLPPRGVGYRKERDEEPTVPVPVVKPEPQLRRKGSTRKPPPRVESTQPRDTTPEPDSSGEETAGEEHFAIRDEGVWVSGQARLATANVPMSGAGAGGSGGFNGGPGGAPAADSVDASDDGDWVDEDDDPDDDDLLELEYHPSYVSNTEKRRRRWDSRWEALVEAFQALDRQTDTTLVLLAAPPHSSKLHTITSRSIRRQPGWQHMPAMAGLRSNFRKMATYRRSVRAQRPSLVDRLMMMHGASSSSGSGAEGTGSDSSGSASREEELKRVLDAALGSLGALGEMYDHREARWHEEMRRIKEDREMVELLLGQALGGPPMKSMH
ncbi:hypothetical protein HGRIS_008928 [Hohenbuehelia grisea]|uniref:Uncharacterized protein n=1 Tax=Hohenbuehelia grisea TaxID=104357 RepID=A0ABR3IZP4_9AGAR